MANYNRGLSWRSLTVGGLLAGIGFTMALFIASLGFSEKLINNAKLGILAASIVSAAAGLAVLMSGAKKKTLVSNEPIYSSAK